MQLLLINQNIFFTVIVNALPEDSIVMNLVPAKTASIVVTMKIPLMRHVNK